MPVAPPSSRARRVTTVEIPVAAPFRLDLTVSALRRLPANLVDVYTADGRYLRALGGFRHPVVVSVTQPRPDRLAVSVRAPARDVPAALDHVRRILGTERDLSDFQRQARKISWLAPLARRMRGLRPPRYPTLFEACLNAVLFQQVSLHAGSAILNRLVVALGTRVEHDGVTLVVFPTVDRVLGADDAEIRGFGISAGKLSTLRRVGEAITAGELSEAILDNGSSPEISRLLCGIKGIGPWTAAVILLRGMGRLDAFPGNDSSVPSNLALVAGKSLDAGSVVESLGSQRGMLYFHLLLARLEARGQIGRASDVAT